jgi:ferredoxin
MTDDVYQRLREHLDLLPGGFPATESGVEIRILKRLFTPEEAELAQQVKLKLETADKIAERAGMDPDQALAKLRDMASKGLIFSIDTGERPPSFMAAQFVIGIWEYQVQRLEPDFVRDVEEYMPHLAREAFQHLPQLRTIPIGRSLTPEMNILPYEKAEELITGQKDILVAPCICRREREVKGEETCGKLMDSCLVFGWAAHYYERNNLGRKITADEALEILHTAEEEGLVLQPSNTQDITNICCCCGDCCQVLVNLKRHPSPATIAATPFILDVDEGACSACETCVDRCQMDALTVDDVVHLNADRCIGCGLCVPTCPEEALSLVRKPEDQAPATPKGMVQAAMERMQSRIKADAELADKLQRHQMLG